jgi:hydrogenase maturation protease
MKTVVIGLGNPILSDDGAGVRASRLLREALGGRADIEVKEAYAGGIRLMDELVGYGRAVIVDAMVTGRHRPGTVRRLPPSELGAARNTSSTHDTNLATAIEMGRMLGLELPGEVLLWGIEAGDVETFGEELTGAVERALPVVVEEILECLETDASGGVKHER